MHHVASTPLLTTLRLGVAELVRELGVTGASRELHVSRESIARLVAGLPVRQGTTALVARRLYELACRKEAVR